MKIVDANVLLYAVNEDAPQHPKARRWLEHALSGSEPVGFDWTVLLAFLRLSTRSAIFPHPLSPAQAFETMRSWLEQPCAEIVDAAERHLDVLEELLKPLGSAGNLTADAHLAALALEFGAELVSCDTDFSRFPGLRWTNPVA
ncbi:MAG: PIN domain-containing protein [Planctomycetaceae bacterium]|nr:PIN domain-containing protein [Planctomycetaceae bacterium]